MSGDLNLEQRYRRVMRLLPGYYRDTWEEDMVAAFMISVPGNPGECVRPLDTPVTITSASVSAVASFQPRTPSGQPQGPPVYQIMITLPAADVTAATAVVTTAYDSQGGVDFSVAGRTWALPMVFRPFRSQQLSIALPSKNQALQLHRLLVSSG